MPTVANNIDGVPYSAKSVEGKNISEFVDYLQNIPIQKSLMLALHKQVLELTKLTFSLPKFASGMFSPKFLPAIFLYYTIHLEQWQRKVGLIDKMFVFLWSTQTAP